MINWYDWFNPIRLHLPDVGTALALALLVTYLVRICLDRFRQDIKANSRLNLLRGCFVTVLAGCLIPLDGSAVSHYGRVLTGDLSLVTLAWFTLVAWQTLAGFGGPGTTRQPIPHSGRRVHPQELIVATGILLTALILYPTALGLTWFDLYAWGYYPIVLGPMLFALFAWCFWFGYTLPALMLALAFVGYALGLLESDNLWDYLLDPVSSLYAALLLIKQLLIKHKHQWWKVLSGKVSDARGNRIVVAALLVAGTCLGFAVFLAWHNPDAFRNQFVVEDGFIEWFTSLTLLATMIVCLHRVYLFRHPARQGQSFRFLLVTGLLALVCLFGAGEEISWGQRIFNLESPEFFKARNAQGEIGFHNFVVEINGKPVKLNKLIFGTGLAIGLAIYLFVMTPLYRLRPGVRTFLDRLAVPMPENYQIAGYLLVVAVVELLVDSTKRGEMTEFAGSIIFALNVVYPHNRSIFRPMMRGGSEHGTHSD